MQSSNNSVEANEESVTSENSEESEEVEVMDVSERFGKFEDSWTFADSDDCRGFSEFESGFSFEFPEVFTLSQALGVSGVFGIFGVSFFSKVFFK